MASPPVRVDRTWVRAVALGLGMALVQVLVTASGNVGLVLGSKIDENHVSHEMNGSYVALETGAPASLRAA